MDQNVKLQIIELLKQKSAYKVSVNGIQHYTRCPYCGDSVNLNHGHLSIKIDRNTEDPMVYRCLKCDAHGIVTESTLEDLDLLVNKEIIDSIKSINRKAARSGKIVNMEFERYFVPKYHDTPLNRLKLQYVNQRLGTQLTYDDAKEYKIILNLFDFMSANEIDKIDGLYWQMMKTLNSSYVGFLSCNNNRITFRDITGKNKFRYYKVLLNEKNMNSDTFYSLPFKMPLIYTDDVHIHMAEGIFDIISIKENLSHNNAHDIYFASCGFGGLVIIKYLIHHGINTGIHFHIYSDNDKTDYDHKRYLFNKHHYTEWIDKIYLHRNQFLGEKDYGVPSCNIIDRHKMLK